MPSRETPYEKCHEIGQIGTTENVYCGHKLMQPSEKHRASKVKDINAALDSHVVVFSSPKKDFSLCLYLAGKH